MINFLTLFICFVMRRVIQALSSDYKWIFGKSLRRNSSNMNCHRSHIIIRKIALPKDAGVKNIFFLWLLIRNYIRVILINLAQSVCLYDAIRIAMTYSRFIWSYGNKFHILWEWTLFIGLAAQLCLPIHIYVCNAIILCAYDWCLSPLECRHRRWFHC